METTTKLKPGHGLVQNETTKLNELQVNKLRIWSHLLKKYLMENFIFCAVLLATNENGEKQQFLISLGPLPQKVGYFTQFEIFSHIGGSRRSHINLKSEILNLK